MNKFEEQPIYVARHPAKNVEVMQKHPELAPYLKAVARFREQRKQAGAPVPTEYLKVLFIRAARDDMPEQAQTINKITGRNASLLASHPTDVFHFKEMIDHEKRVHAAQTAFIQILEKKHQLQQQKGLQELHKALFPNNSSLNHEVLTDLFTTEQLRLQGKSRKEIAHVLGKSEFTVGHYCAWLIAAGRIPRVGGKQLAKDQALKHKETIIRLAQANPSLTYPEIAEKVSQEYGGIEITDQKVRGILRKIPGFSSNRRKGLRRLKNR